jgi:ferredoxin
MGFEKRFHPAIIALAKKFSGSLYLGPPYDEKLCELINHLFTSSEAEVASKMLLFMPRTPEKIAKKCGFDVAETQSLLDAMHQKRVIIKVKKGYFLLPLIPGMFEYVLMRGDDTPWHREYGRRITALFSSGYISKYINSSMPAIRAVPVQKAVESKTVVGDSSLVLAMIESHTQFGVLNVCQCRQSQRFSGNECKRSVPEDGCLIFGTWAQGLAKGGSGREIGRDEMRNIVEDRWEKNLVFMTANVRADSPNVICTCCDCCCHYLEAVNHFKAEKTLSRPLFIAAVNYALCTNCGRCVKVCNTYAHAIVDKKHVYMPEKCIGCGLCVSACKPGAIEMKKNERNDPPSKTFSRLIARIIPSGIYSIMKTK